MTFLTWLITTTWTLSVIWLCYELRRTTDPDKSITLTRLSMMPRSEYVTRPAADVRVSAWEREGTYTDMVRQSCAGLQKGSVGQHFTANRGADYTGIYDVSESEYSRLLQQDPGCYERNA